MCDDTHIDRLFEKTALQYPDDIAILEKKSSLTFGEVNAIAGRLATMLRKSPLNFTGPVGVYIEKSCEYVTAILGVLKCGATFMPISTAYPVDYLLQILQKTKSNIVITNQENANPLLSMLSPRIQEIDYCHVVVVGDSAKSSRIETLGDPRHRNKHGACDLTDGKPDDCDGCYIITTSGSTGTPKPIWGSHKGLCHFIQWEIDELRLDNSARVSFLSPVSFDVSLRDIFVPLIAGGTLCIPDKEIKIDPRKLVRWMRDLRLSVVHIVPTLFRMVTREIARLESKKPALPDLDYLLLAGEPLLGNDLQRWRKAVGDCRIELINLYGPSETTLAKLYYRVGSRQFAPSEIVPLGKAISDSNVFILDGNRLCLAGETGEIHIQTKFASKGYFNDPQRNRKAFIQNPLDKKSTDLLYRTGDYGYASGDGTIRFVGRKDKQLKIQGKRIDTNQVEMHLEEDPRIRQCAVAPKSDSFGNLRMVAYTVPERDQNPTVEDLKGFLRGRIPDYMIPSVFVAMNELPLTHSGKIDRNALPEPKPERPLLAQAYVSPQSQLQRRLCRIWCDVLRINEVGIYDNFFDIGGTSLLSMVVSERIADELGISIPVVKLFEFPHIHALATYLGGIEKSRPGFEKMTMRGALRRKSTYRHRRLAES